MEGRYRTLDAESQGIYKEKGSKFLAYAYRVDSIEQAQQQLASLKQIHHKARHHCFAYILGADGSVFRASDDGEPKNSAGAPILGQLKAFGLSNILVVVVRYFGGTKLGIGGLVKAYRNATKEALEMADIIEQEVHETWQLALPYHKLNEVMNCLKVFNLKVVDKDFGERCTVKVQVPVAKTALLNDRIISLREVQIIQT